MVGLKGLGEIRRAQKIFDKYPEVFNCFETLSKRLQENQKDTKILIEIFK